MLSLLYIPICTSLDADGIDIHFLNHKSSDRGPSTRASGGHAMMHHGAQVKHLETISPTDACNRLQSVLKPSLNNCNLGYSFFLDDDPGSITGRSGCEVHDALGTLTPIRTPDRRRYRKQNKIFLTVVAPCYGVTVAAVPWTLPRGLRIASGVTASGSAAAVIPIRTIDGVPRGAWIALVFSGYGDARWLTMHSDYAVWAISFMKYLAMQLLHLPHTANHHRQLFVYLSKP